MKLESHLALDGLIYLLGVEGWSNLFVDEG